MNRLVRNPDLLVCWSEEGLLVKDLGSGRSASASGEALVLLDLFGRPRTPTAAADALPEYERRSVLRSISALARVSLLIPEREARSRRSRIAAWKENLASAQY
ncbi:MAG: hypothetical protein ACRD1Z_16745, partial [Vicinamibacteria bacterium]